jgi:sensor histidine kinase regulating citrate/malate metabolism
MRRMVPTLPLQWKLTILVVALILFSGVVAGYFSWRVLTKEVDGMMGSRLLGLARMVAARPEVADAFALENPSMVLQPMADTWAFLSGIDFIVILGMDAIRYTHPNRDLLGKRFTGGDEEMALLGGSYVSKAVGISGPSMRAFTPVYDRQGEQIGVVVVGTWMSNFSQHLDELLAEMAGLSLLGLAVGVIGATVLAYTIKRSIFGLEPEQIGKILEERVAILQSIREGVVAVDEKNRITMINGEAARLLGVGEGSIGRPVKDVLPTTRLPEVVASAQPDYDQEQTVRGTAILTNRVPVILRGRVVGAVATFRDMSEMRELAAELTGVKQLAEALRAQAHEFMNRLHTISGLLQLGRHDEAVNYISTVTRTHEEFIGFVTRRIHEPTLAGLLLGKISAAHERGINLSLDPDSHVPARDSRLDRVDLVTVVGNLLENAFDAVALLGEERRNVWLSMYADDREMTVEVEDAGVGIREDYLGHLFDRGFTTKPGNKGIGLCLLMHEVQRAGGTVDVDSQEGVGTRFSVRFPLNGAGIEKS